MKAIHKLLPITLILFIITSLSSCQFIVDVFKGGVYVGIILVVVVVALIIWLLSKIGSK